MLEVSSHNPSLQLQLLSILQIQQGRCVSSMCCLEISKVESGSLLVSAVVGNWTLSLHQGITLIGIVISACVYRQLNVKGLIEWA